MITTHANLYRAVDPETGRTVVMAHAAPRNGQVHSGHPRCCASPDCQVWARTLPPEADPDVDRINDMLHEEEDSLGQSIIACVLIGCVLIGAAVWWWMHRGAA